jgi:hypothetical protein
VIIVSQGVTCAGESDDTGNDALVLFPGSGPMSCKPDCVSILTFAIIINNQQLMAVQRESHPKVDLIRTADASRKGCRKDGSCVIAQLFPDSSVTDYAQYSVIQSTILRGAQPELQRWVREKLLQMTIVEPRLRQPPSQEPA